MRDRPISAAILAGGESRRFGTDKALAMVPGGRERIIDRTVRVLRQVAEDVTIIAPTHRPYSDLGVPIVSEQPSGEGPLGGLIAALTIAKHPRCIVVSCDLPLLSPRLLEWMAFCPDSFQALVPVVGRAPRPQPLHAIYTRSCLEPATRLFADGERRLLSLLDAIETVFVAERDLRAIDQDLASFVNVNSMDDWDAAARLAAGLGSATKG